MSSLSPILNDDKRNKFSEFYNALQSKELLTKMQDWFASRDPKLHYKGTGIASLGEPDGVILLFSPLPEGERIPMNNKILAELRNDFPIYKNYPICWKTIAITGLASGPTVRPSTKLLSKLYGLVVAAQRLFP